MRGVEAIGNLSTGRVVKTYDVCAVNQQPWIRSQHSATGTYMASLADQITPKLVSSIIPNLFPLQESLCSLNSSQPDVEIIVLHTL